MRVLNLVTNAEARFYKQQVRALADVGVDCDTLQVPASHDASRAGGSRSPLDYLRFVPRVLREADDRYDLVHANYGLTAPAALAQRGVGRLRPDRWLSGLLGGSGRRPAPAGPVGLFGSRVAARAAGARPVDDDGEREAADRDDTGQSTDRDGGRQSDVPGDWRPDDGERRSRPGGLPVVLSLWGSDLFGRFGPVSRYCARACDAVVVMSPAMADALGTDCEVVPHGVDLELFHPMDRTAARAAVGWPDDRAHVLFPYPPTQSVKNYPLAERVVAAATDRLDRPVELQSVSGVPHDRMPLYLNAADALLLASDHEGSPNAVKEALACNVPVVATDVGDVEARLAGVEPSAVCRGEAELVAGLTRVLADGRRSNGREAARAVSLERMAEELLAVYRDVVGQ